jgi:hypothetical protein
MAPSQCQGSCRLSKSLWRCTLVSRHRALWKQKLLPSRPRRFNYVERLHDTCALDLRRRIGAAVPTGEACAPRETILKRASSNRTRRPTIRATNPTPAGTIWHWRACATRGVVEPWGSSTLPRGRAIAQMYVGAFPLALPERLNQVGTTTRPHRDLARLLRGALQRRLLLACIGQAITAPTGK